MFNNIKQFSIFFFLLVFVFPNTSLNSQVTKNNCDSIVQWISQFPPLKEDKTKHSFIKRISEIITIIV